MATRYMKLFSPVSLRHFTRKFSDRSEPKFLGIKTKFTDVLKFVNSDSYEAIPIYRVLSSPTSQLSNPGAKVRDELLLKMYESMVRVTILDKILNESQRQGRIPFYVTNIGEESLQIGSAAGLTLEDVIYAQYREAGVLMWRGYTYTQMINQCYGNHEDPGKGKQLPVHYGAKELNFVTISSPVGTQISQAVGAAYAMKRAKKNACVICYFGEGTASEGDAHAGLNFAATLDCPIVFICRNNGYAVSTPTTEQYRGDGIGARGPAYGINTVRVDGNDVLAVLHATRTAREFCIENGKPVLLEAMSYRMGHHTTSDDSMVYRTKEEIEEWSKHLPIPKFRQYLEHLGLWSEDKESNLQKSLLNEFLSEIAKAEKKQKPNWRETFTDVYQDIPEHIAKQMTSMERHLQEYGKHYPLQEFHGSK